MAFEMVCPDRIDLIHKNYRKLCTLLVDVDEWGQVIILNMLTRYARSQFLDPNKEVSVCMCVCVLNVLKQGRAWRHCAVDYVACVYRGIGLSNFTLQSFLKLCHVGN